MKKVILLVLVMSVILSGCVVVEFPSSTEAVDNTNGNELKNEQVAEEEYSGNSSVEEIFNEEVFSEEEVLNQLAVTEYSLNKDGYYYHFFEVTNKSCFVINVSVDVKYYNENTELIGVGSDYADVIGTDQTILLTAISNEEYSGIEYEISVTQENYYKTAVPYMSYEAIAATEKEIVAVTNNGENEIESPYGYILFFNGDTVVAWGGANFHGDEWVLKPGETEYREMHCDVEYDTYKLYLLGYTQ